MNIKAVIFDLDGVIVSTDDYHYRAWKRIANEEGIYFDREINERLRGVSRVDSLEIILEKSSKEYSQEEKYLLAERKNNIYRELLNELTQRDILPGVMAVLNMLKENGIKISIGSSSKNTMFILDKINLNGFFDSIADGTQITKSKPDPEVFLLAADKLGVSPVNCLVVEDSDVGVEAALAVNMKVLAVGYAAKNEKANLRMKNLNFFKYNDIKEL